MGRCGTPPALRNADATASTAYGVEHSHTLVQAGGDCLLWIPKLASCHDSLDLSNATKLVTAQRLNPRVGWRSSVRVKVCLWGADVAGMTYTPVGVDGDPFARTQGPSIGGCQVCGGPIAREDIFCRSCGVPGPSASDEQSAAWLTRSPAVPRSSDSALSSLRINGGLLLLAAFLLAGGCKLPWVSAEGLPMQLGLTPPVSEIWPVLAGAAALGLLGLAALAQAERLDPGSWLLAVLVALGIGAFMFPKFRVITQEVIDFGELGASHGVGLWAIGGGIIVALMAGAAGRSASKR